MLRSQDLAYWRDVAGVCHRWFRCWYVRQIGLLFIDLKDAQTITHFGNLRFLHRDRFDGAVVRAGDLDTGLVTLHFTEWKVRIED